MKKMGYEGKSLGVNSQVIMNPIQVVELLWYIGLGYVRKEETWDSSSDKSETMQDVEITSPPSSDSENFEGRAKEISPQHTCTRGNHSRKIMSIKKETWHKDSSPHQGRKKFKKLWRRKKHCTHCNKGGHQRTTSWDLHPELWPKKDREHMKTLVKGPTDEAIQKGSQLQEESPLT